MAGDSRASGLQRSDALLLCALHTGAMAQQAANINAEPLQVMKKTAALHAAPARRRRAKVI